MTVVKGRAITRKGAKEKGKKLEREVAKALKNIGIDAKRVPMSGALSWLKGDVAELGMDSPHVHECKNAERIELLSWWKQAASQAKNGEIPVLHFTCNYRPIYTALRSVDFDNLALYLVELGKFDPHPVTLPPRTHFWKFLDGSRGRFNQFYLDVEGESLVIVELKDYLRIRKRWLEYTTGLTETPAVAI